MCCCCFLRCSGTDFTIPMSTVCRCAAAASFAVQEPMNSSQRCPLFVDVLLLLPSLFWNRFHDSDVHYLSMCCCCFLRCSGTDEFKPTMSTICRCAAAATFAVLEPISRFRCPLFVDVLLLLPSLFRNR